MIGHKVIFFLIFITEKRKSAHFQLYSGCEGWHGIVFDNRLNESVEIETVGMKLLTYLVFSDHAS